MIQFDLYFSIGLKPPTSEDMNLSVPSGSGPARCSVELGVFFLGVEVWNGVG